MKRFLKCYVLSLLLLNLAACSTMQTVNVENTIQTSYARGVDYGSLVHVKTTDKRSAKFRVTEITEEGLGGNGGFYRFDEMESLKVDVPGSNDTAVNVVLGILAVVALVALVSNSDAVKVCSPSPCPEE